MRHRQLVRPTRSFERGAILIQVALALVVLMGMTAFVIDHGVVWMGRGQAQDIADAAALAGATSLAFDDGINFSSTGPAYLAAQQMATLNTIPLLTGGTGAPQVDIYVGQPAVRTDWPPSPGAPIRCTTAGDGPCVQVNVFADGSNGGGTLPAFFGPLFGRSSQQTKATATAQAIGANAVKCLKPFGMIDKWAEIRALDGTTDDGKWYTGENGDSPASGPPISTFDKYLTNGANKVLCATSGTIPNCAPTVDSYTSPAVNGFVADQPWAPNKLGDYGRQIALHVGDQNDRPPMNVGGPNPFVAGWFIPISWGTGTGDYVSFIEGCDQTEIGIGDTVNINNVPGNRVQKTAQGVGCGPPSLPADCDAGQYKQDPNSLYKQDPGAYWDSSCNGGKGCVAGSAYAISPRMVPIALVSVDDYIQATNNGAATITLINIVGAFIDGFRAGTDQKVQMHITTLPGDFVSGKVTVGKSNSFLKIISLVR